jgi:uncharacterized protein (DUF1810 family)
MAAIRGNHKGAGQHEPKAAARLWSQQPKQNQNLERSDMAEEYRLGCFLEAQAPVYGTVLAELRAGRKRSHWVWFVFPQIAGLGVSPTSTFFAIGSLAEARAYADHPVLGARLAECAGLVLAHKDKPAATILGTIDAVKFRSSMTLFEAARPEVETYAACLDAFFRGERDPETLARI